MYLNPKIKVSRYDIANVKINQIVAFKFRGKNMTGRVVTIGFNKDVNVVCNGKYYYCYDYSRTGRYYKKANIINYSDIKTR